MHPAPRAAVRFAAALCAALLGACATLPDPPPATETPSTGTTLRLASQISTPKPVFEPASPAARPGAPPPAAPSRPLDATRLPPFDGEKREVREPLRGVATVDRTIRPDDLWERIRAGFSMPTLEGQLVQDRTAWYAARPDYLVRTLDRSRRYLYHIVEELEKRGMPTELALLPMVESSFNPMAYSRAHASGLWQFIPGTGKRYDLAQNWWYDGRRDIVASTSAALDYLKDIYEMHGDWHLALASYNWGENAVAKAIERNRAAGLPMDYSSLRMPEETRYYVPKLQALKNIIANPGPFGIALDPIPNQPYFATITKSRDIDIKLAARLAEMPVEEFVALNPGFNRPFIPVSINPRIVLPAGKVAVFHANLQKLDEKKLVSWQTYQPKAGDKLEAIAKKFGVSLVHLREVNGLTARTRGLPSLLVVPVGGIESDSSARQPIMYAPPIPVAATQTRVHNVVAGETLISIATLYRVTPDDLRRWNPIGRLTPGQKLRIEVAAPTAKSTPVRESKRSEIKHKSKKPPVKKKIRKEAR